MKLSNQFLWTISNAVSVVLAASIGFMWHATHARYDPDPGQLTSERAVEQYLQSQGIDFDRAVSTGIFIKSFTFVNTNRVNLTGYVWQRYNDGDRDRCNVVFPEAVDWGNNVMPEIAYKRQVGNAWVVGCHFQATLQQRFNYSKYPFDHKTALVRMWSEDVFSERVLLPDLSSYQSTEKADAFGYDKNIFLDGWDIEGTFFDYKHFDYSTNFGVGHEVPDRGRPELFFNIVVKRKLWNVLLIHVVPFAAVELLLFSTLILTKSNEDPEAKSETNPSEVVGFCSGMFFTLLLAQIHLRQKLAGSGIVYLEYLYAIAYFVILAMAVNSFLLNRSDDSRLLRWVRYRHNLLPKILFWPVVLGASAFVTLTVLEPFSPRTSEAKISLLEPEERGSFAIAPDADRRTDSL